MTNETITIDTEQWAVVPRVPTQSMLAAAYNAIESEGIITTTWMRETIYRAMVEMAPTYECSHCGGFGEVSGESPGVVCPACLGLGKEHPSAPRPEAGQQATHSDDLAVEQFAMAMKAKLAKKRDQGRGGWETCPPEILSKMLVDHIAKGDPVDVANFCMMLHQNGHGIARQAEPRPVPTSERLPTAAEADFNGSVWAYSNLFNQWKHVRWQAVAGTAAFSHWQPTGLVRPAEPELECLACNGSGHAQDQSGEACTACFGNGVRPAEVKP